MFFYSEFTFSSRVQRPSQPGVVCRLKNTLSISPSLGLFLKKLNRRTRNCLEEARAWQCKASSSPRARHQEPQGIHLEQQTGPGSPSHPTSPARGWAAGGFWGSHNPRYCHSLGELKQPKAGSGWQPVCQGWHSRAHGQAGQCGGLGQGLRALEADRILGFVRAGGVSVEVRWGSQVHQCSQLWQAALGGTAGCEPSEATAQRVTLPTGQSPGASQQDWVGDIDSHSKARNENRSSIQTGGARDTWRQDYHVGPSSVKETGLERRQETMLPSTLVLSKCRKTSQQDRAVGIRMGMSSVFE